MDAALTPFVTVIVPVRNEARCIERTLTKLATQNYRADRFEIIVADGVSTDSTASIVRQVQHRFPSVRLLENPKRLSSAARNLGVRHGRGEYFVVIDGHCNVDDPAYVRKLVTAFQSSGADCLGRPQPLEIPAPSAIQQAIAMARRSWLGHNPDSHIYSSRGGFVPASTVAVAYRRHVFERVGGFDERFDACEDVEFNHRVDCAGMRCWFAPEIAVHYHPRTSIGGVAHQMSRYGRGRLRLAAKHPRSLRAPTIAPLAFFLSLVTCALLSPISWFFAATAVAGLACYFGAIVLATLLLMRETGRFSAKCYLPLVFIAIHVGFAWGTFRELCRTMGALVIGRQQTNSAPMVLAPVTGPVRRAA